MEAHSSTRFQARSRRPSDRFLERVLVALLAQGHLLSRALPGAGQALTVRTLAADARAQLPERIQFTPDSGAGRPGRHRASTTRKTGEFGPRWGRCSPNLLLADEINRAPAKVQMHCSSDAGAPGDDRRRVAQGASPFVVMATQNPIETEGTYPLPERRSTAS